MIPQTFIDEIQTRTDITDLISSYIPLKRAGRNFKALCPFHSEKTPSFLVSPQKQIFHCFGCGEGGGAIQFLMLHERVSFTEAVEILAKRLGLEIPYQRSTTERLKTALYEVANEASLFFHKNILEDSAQAIRQYLANRGIDIETIKKFRLGYATGHRSLLDYLRKKGFTLEVLEKAALIQSTEGQWRDLFWERITFPIFDVRFRVVGFGARLIKDTSGAPKYINSPENPLYSKREHLFGLNLSKDDIVKEGSVIVVEGYLDMIIPFVHGIRNVVASLGTALTLEQINLLRRYTSSITLVYDADKAGQLATLRAVDTLLEYELKVKIVPLPKGFDPDSLVREKGKEHFSSLIEKRVDFFEYKMQLLKGLYDIETIDGKVKVTQEMFSTISKLKSEIERYEYIKKLSERLRIKEEILIAEFRNLTGKQSTVIALKTAEPLPITERVLLKFMLTNPKAFSIVKKSLREEDFTSPLARKIVSYLFTHAPAQETTTCAPLKFTSMPKDKEINGFISQVLMDEDVALDSEQFKMSLEKLRLRRLKNVKAHLRQELKDAEAKGDCAKRNSLIAKWVK